MSEPEADISASSDPSASTAQFRAFASQAGGEAERPWSMRVSGGKVALLAAAIIVVVVVLIIIAISVTSS